MAIFCPHTDCQTDCDFWSKLLGPYLPGSFDWWPVTASCQHRFIRVGMPVRWVWGNSFLGSISHSVLLLESATYVWLDYRWWVWVDGVTLWGEDKRIWVIFLLHVFNTRSSKGGFVRGATCAAFCAVSSSEGERLSSHCETKTSDKRDYSLRK